MTDPNHRSFLRRRLGAAATATTAAAAAAALGLTAAVVPLPSTAAASAAPEHQPIVIVAHTDFSQPASRFESSLPSCPSGVVANGAGGAHFTPWGGVFVGEKVFTCAGDQGGFTIGLRARFGEPGSLGTWTLDAGWGTMANLRGSGSLAGVVTELGIDDVYTGSLRT